jgi:ATPase family associated with various cellular activities (AAA)
MWTGAEATAAALERELAWLEQSLQARMARHFGTGEAVEPAPPPLDGVAGDAWAALVRHHALDAADRLLLALALAPSLRPQVLDLLFVRNRNLDRGFAEFGGWKGKVHGGFLPSGETAAFLLGGESLTARFEALQRLEPGRPLRRANLLQLEPPEPGEPPLSGALLPTPDVLALLTAGRTHRPEHGPGFPARRLETALRWSDLVLSPEVMDEVQAIAAWVRDGAALLADWGLDRALKPGWRSLFHGPPGTGKTLTATLIGQAAGADVYRIDLSMVVSKYIGETEKNLATVFDQAEHRGWVLFFDEADALFGKRTATSSSNDRYANQEVSYLLQRVEDFAGTVILASNLKANIDEAFARRFQSMVHFPLPDAEQRLQLWRGLLGDPKRLGNDVDLAALSAAHELSGGAIANVVRHAAVCAHRAGRRTLAGADLKRGIARELRKEGRTMQEVA